VIVAKNHQRFSLRPSKILVLASVGLAVWILLLLILLPIVFWIKLLAIISVGLFFYQSITAMRLAQMEELVFNSETDLRNLYDRDDLTELRLQPDQFITDWLIIIYFRTPEGFIFRRAITKDVVNSAEHHQLRSLLLSRSIWH
jgi:hypothetical protein